MINLTKFYTDAIQNVTVEIQRLKRLNPLFLSSELVTFLMAVFLFYRFFSSRFVPMYIVWFFLLFAVYLYIRFRDKRNENKIESLQRLRSVYQNELSALKGDFSPFDTGIGFMNPQHAFSLDMDVFGEKSLYNQLNRTVTSMGSERLADRLTRFPKTVSEVCDSQFGLQELKDKVEWRCRFISVGHQIDSNAVKQAVEQLARVQTDGWIHGRLFPVAVSVSVTAFLVLVILSGFHLVSGFAPLLMGSIQFFVTILFTANKLNLISDAVTKMQDELSVYLRLIRHILSERFEAGINKKTIAPLTDAESDALAAFAKLSSLKGELDRRGNMVFFILSNAFCCYDFFLIKKFVDWRSSNVDKMPIWLRAVSDMDASISLATYCFNHPTFIFPQLVESDKVIYEARSLSHPFLGDSAVANDFSIIDGHYYIITGANMAGKSTFLRTIGLNYILSMCGLPVSAASMQVSVFHLFSSMRTTDNLTRGVSYFNAELLRLKQLMQACQKAAPTLIILDEILKGTNSLDKLNGSKLFLHEISKLPVTGIVATHDLELSKLENDESGRFHNFCFEIEMAENIVYSYKITPGVARNQNATYLLKNMIQSI